MDFKLLSEMLDDNVVIDLIHATDKELRVNYDPADEAAWFVIEPQKFRSEHDLAAIINAKCQIKLQSRERADFGGK